MRILPDAVRGKSVTTRSSSGHFCRARPTRSSCVGDVASSTPRAGREPHDRARVLAEAGVGRRDHRDLGDLGQRDDRLLDLGRGDVLAAADDHVVDAGR